MKISLSKKDVETAITKKHGKGKVTFTEEGGAEIETNDEATAGFSPDDSDPYEEPEGYSRRR